LNLTKNFGTLNQCKTTLLSKFAGYLL